MFFGYLIDIRYVGNFFFMFFVLWFKKVLVLMWIIFWCSAFDLSRMKFLLTYTYCNLVDLSWWLGVLIYLWMCKLLELYFIGCKYFMMLLLNVWFNLFSTFDRFFFTRSTTVSFMWSVMFRLGFKRYVWNMIDCIFIMNLVFFLFNCFIVMLLF